MARRRMFDVDVIDTDAFFDLTPEAQSLYFNLAMRADDDGMVDKTKTILRMMGLKEVSLRQLAEAGFVICFDSGVAAITHWRLHNSIKSDRYHPSRLPERALLDVAEDETYILKDGTNLEPTWNQNGNELETNGSEMSPTWNQNGKKVSSREGKVREGKGRGDITPPYPPEGEREVDEPTEAKETKQKPPPKADPFTEYTESEALRSALKDFEAMRKTAKKPMTDRAKRLLLRELEKICPDDEAKQIEVLEQSVLHNWQTVYPLKEGSNDGRAGGRVLAKPGGRAKGYIPDPDSIDWSKEKPGWGAIDL